MTEFGETILKQLIDQGLITFYCRYVDDTCITLLSNLTQLTSSQITFACLTRTQALLMISLKTPFLIFWIPTSRLTASESTAKTPLPANIPTLTALFCGVRRFFWIRALVERTQGICLPNLLKFEFKQRSSDPGFTNPSFTNP